MTSYVSPKKNSAFIFYGAVVSQANTNTMQSNPTIAAGDFKVSIDGGALANLATLPAVTPASSVMVKFSLSAAEMNGDNITVVCIDAAGAEWCDAVFNIQTSARQIDDLAYPTVTGRSLDVSAGGEAGIDWANIGSPTTAVNLSATNIDVDQVVASVSGAVGSVTGAVGSVTGAVGSVTGAVGSVATGGIAAASFATGAIDAAALAADAGTEIGTAVWATTTRVLTAATNITSTGGTTVPQTGDSFARIGVAGASLTDLGGMSTTMKGQVQTEAEDALVVHRLDELLNADSDIDGLAPPTVGSVFHELLTKTAGSFTYDQTTDSLEAVRDRGDAAWITATGFSTHTAADVWSVVTRVLTAGTNIVLAKGVGVTGFNDVAATDIVSAGAITTSVGKVSGVILTDALTTYTGNTVQTGDSFARIGLAGAGLTNINLPNQTMDITGSLSGSVGSVTGAVGSVTGLTASNLDATVSSRLASASYTAPDNATIAVIAADLPTRITKNVALAAFPFLMLDSADHFTPKTGLTITATRSIDGAAFAACANAVTETSNGWYQINLSASDMNGNTIALKFTATGADSRNVTIVTQPT